MKHILIILLIAITYIKATEPISIISKTLPNGLKIKIIEKHDSPLVNIQLGYNVGSFVEKKGEKGMAHLFEHMMFRGSKNVKDNEHSQLIQKYGGSNNAYTSDDRTVYYETIPKEKFEDVLKLEADRMQNLIINKDKLETEKKVVLEEYRWRYENNPQGEIFRKVTKQLFKGHPYEYSAIGKKEDIKNFTVEQCTRFYKKYYSPHNATLTIVGDIKASEGIKIIEKHFGNIPSSKVDTNVDLNLPPKTIHVSDTSSFPIPLTLTSFYLPPADHPDRLILDVLFNILDGDESSRLHKKIVKEKELAIYFLSFPHFSKGTGVYGLAAVHIPGLSKKIQKTIFQEINNIIDKGVTTEELNKTINQTSTGKILQRYKASAIGSEVLYDCMILKKPNFINEEIDQIKQIKNKDIKRVAKQYLSQNQASTIYFKPTKTNKFIYPFLSIYGHFKALFK